MQRITRHFTSRGSIAVALLATILVSTIVFTTSEAEAQRTRYCEGHRVTVDMTMGQVPNSSVRSVVWGTEGADTIQTGARDDIICGNGGNDTIRGGLGNDRIDGGAGNDTIEGQSGDDIITGGTGNDRIYLGPGKDFAFGQSGNDWIDGASGNDTISGGSGADSLYGKHGNDTLRGYSGGDNLIGGGGNDRLEGGSDSDYMHGGSGHDRMDGGPGDDRMFGVAGNDTLSGSTGHDWIYGGTGADRVYGDNVSTSGQEGGGNDFVHGGSGNDYVYGGYGDDHLVGAQDNDQLRGNSGNDRLEAGGGDDVLFGHSGNDKLDGSSGYDIVDGGSGIDTCDGYERLYNSRTFPCTMPTVTWDVSCGSYVTANLTVKNNGKYDSVYEFQFRAVGDRGAAITVNPTLATLRPGESRTFNTNTRNDASIRIEVKLRRNGSTFKSWNLAPCGGGLQGLGICGGFGGGVGPASIGAGGCVWRDDQGRSWVSGEVGGTAGLGSIGAGFNAAASLAWLKDVPVSRLPNQDVCIEIFIAIVGGAVCDESHFGLRSPNLFLGSVGVGAKADLSSLKSVLEASEGSMNVSLDLIDEAIRVTNSQYAGEIRTAVCSAHGLGSLQSAHRIYPDICPPTGTRTPR